ncbi:hypothetical protein Y032_0108g54 [Ancylostoma ceylanicum]|uniref:Uncharacterized protein n=1 Tax=Ancylostoma ceylanicum TaxID=53326 RepID=A0A016TF99_9BILA|nr:hypothetical protein Y032_0108g54 [Ancylostoma ceylanicum]
MNNTVLNYWKFTQRSVRTIILTKWSQEDWRVLDGPQNLGLILRSSRSTRIPCISFNKVRLLKSTLERLSKSVEESGVVINQCEFNNCQFQCGVYDLVTFLEISKVQRVAIIGSVTGRPIFMKYLLGSAYVKTISLAIIIGSNCSTLPLFPHAVFMPENLKIVLNAWSNGTHGTFQFFMVRTKIPVMNKPSSCKASQLDPIKDFPYLQCRRNVYTYFKNGVRMKIKREHNHWLFNCHSVGFINSYFVEHLGYF